MEILDQSYLNDLVIRAGSGESNAFAELFTATWETQYAYLYRMTQDKTEAVQALREVYTEALKRLPSLNNAGLFLPWLSHMSYLYCRERQGREQGELFPLPQILNLPLTESQILLMTYVQELTDEETGRILNLGRTALRRYRNAGLRHLHPDMRESSGTERAGQQKNIRFSAKKRPAESSRLRESREYRESEKPDAAAVTEILESIFDACGQKPNTVPAEALASYAVYRKERFTLQKGILAAGLIAFLLLPLLFLLPDIEVHGTEEGERGLPVYTIGVHSLLPVRKVTARLQTHALPVYEAGAKEYTVEPTRNGTMTVYVELVNRQSVQKTVQVENVDAKGPELTGSEVGEDTFLLRVADAGIGVDYREIWAMGASGTVYHPLETDEEKGKIVFAYPEETWDVYIPDHIGNTLHLALTLQ